MKSWFRTEDSWAVWIGLLIFGMALALLAGVDLLGWGVKTRVWVDIAQAMTPVSATYAGLPGPISLLLTFLFLLVVLSIGAGAMGMDVRQFAAGFIVIFALSYGCYLLGHNAYIAATPDKRVSFGIKWSIGLTGEAGYILALLAGLFIGNFLPGVTAWLREATRPEWFIKTGIVILGAVVGIKAVGAMGLTNKILLRGLAAIIEGYLIYWALVYFIARKYFGFSREWAAPLASGISICGVSAAIATGAAIRARPVVPIMVSSLVVIFAVVELLLLPFLASSFLGHEPLVAGAWMGLAVKTDGAAAASGALADALISSPGGYEPGWVLATTITVKTFIDVFIGIWAFILALIWVYRVDPKPGEVVRLREIWDRFPKFVIGYFFTFAALVVILRIWRGQVPTAKNAVGESDLFRGLFFAMTFFTIGLTANFKKLWAEGIGRLALVYVVSLFGFIIWIGLLISWIFFAGIRPDTLGGP